MEKITSTKNRMITTLISYKEKKHQFSEKKYLVEGINIIYEAIKNEVVELILGTKKYSTKFKSFSNYIEINDSVSQKISDLKNTQSIFAVCKFNQKNIYKDSNILMLDGIQDPGNLGTLIRSAHAFGFKNIICSEETVSLYNPKVLRATQGNHFNMWINYGKLKDIVNQFKADGYKIITTDVNQKNNKFKLKNYQKDNFILILGNEGSGIAQDLVEMGDENIFLPMENTVESLNVGVAGSIIMYEIYNQK